MRTKKGRNNAIKNKRLTRKRRSKKTIRRNYVNKNRKRLSFSVGGFHRPTKFKSMFGISKHTVNIFVNGLNENEKQYDGKVSKEELDKVKKEGTVFLNDPSSDEGKMTRTNYG